jgi:NAD(P)-dependent dehydrogenase (short-subunit alcohol dehydrogenase family)
VYNLPMEIEERIAVVTGAAVGSGRAIALALSAAGAEVIAADIDEREGRRTVAEADAKCPSSERT